MIDVARSTDIAELKSLDTQNAESSARSGSAYVWLAGALAVLASAPALFARQIFGDDWTVYYVYWTEGAAGLARLMWRAAHGGYTVPMWLFVAILPDMPELAARIGGLACHLVSGALLYRALSLSPFTRPIAALATALFLVSPFYVIRLTQNAAYDFFLVFYLLSLVLMNDKARVLRWIAPIFLLFSLSLETLIALEPLRLLLAWRAGERWTNWIARLFPFWLAILVVIALRLTIMGKSGHYAGQYAPIADINVIVSTLAGHLRAFPRALTFAYQYALAFSGHAIALLLMAVTMAVFGLFGTGLLQTKRLLETRKSVGNGLVLLALGAAIAVIGGLPYALVGIYGDVTRGESRLLFPSQFGILLLLATAIQCVPAARVRAAVAGGTLVVFALSMAHDSKWLLYDGLVTTDLQRQARAALLADPGPKLVMLQFADSKPLFYRHRCLGASDMNVTQAILRDETRERSFIYTDNCGDFTNPDIVPRGRCPISYLDGFSCPAQRETWLYRTAPGIPPLADIGMVELLRAVLDGSPSATGGRGELLKLTGDQLSPLARAVYKPPCNRSGANALLWLLAIPSPNCVESKATN
jgi:hypothetical protein